MSMAIVTQTQNHNKRTANCAVCRTRLTAGQGYRVERIYSSPYYLCQSCHDHRHQLNEMEPELNQVLKQIRDWCWLWVTLNCGWSASSHVEAMIRRTDLNALEIAQEIRDRLLDLDEYTYGSVVTLAKEVIWNSERGEK